MTATRYLQAIRDRIGDLEDEITNIDAAAALCAERIAAGGVVHVFGAGHSRMMCEEAYPRIGAVVGFHPVVELAVTYFTPVVGGSGLKQALFLERVPGYGAVIFAECGARAGDAVLIFSSSGAEHIIIDFAQAAIDAGLPIVAVTSNEYSSAVREERGEVTTLSDIADIVIDNHVPVGDALVDLDGLDERVGASASVLNLSIMDAITSGTAAALLASGNQPLVFASPHLAGVERSEERMDQCLAAYEERVLRRSAP